MSWGDYPTYVTVAQRQARARKKIKALSKRGRKLQPVELQGRTLAATFWGKAWNKNLESYSDYSNRLPRGRSYVRHGAVLDLRISEGRIDALVDGTSTYDIVIKIDPLPRDQWAAILEESSGKIDSLVELLQGRLSKAVMDVVTRSGTGLFPTPRQIHLSCSCPDWATLCKHVAACLYGVGARLDSAPDLLFLLRGVDPAEMIAAAVEQGAPGGAPTPRRILDADSLAAIFGADIDFDVKSPPAPRSSDDLSEDAAQVLALIAETPGLRTPQLSETLDMARSPLLRAITALKKRGLIRYVGARRNGGYEAS